MAGSIRPGVADPANALVAWLSSSERAQRDDPLWQRSEGPAGRRHRRHVRRPCAPLPPAASNFVQYDLTSRSQSWTTEVCGMCLVSMNISLRQVTKSNWVDIINLEISKDQEQYVALNSEALAASKFFEHYVNRAIYLDECPVGFLQYYPNHENGHPNEIFIDQLMIDIGRQGEGMGTIAIALAIEEIAQLDEYTSISVCHVPGHDVIQRFFKRFGFEVVEQDEFEEVVMRLQLTPRSS